MIQQALRTYWNALNPKNLKKEQTASFFCMIYMIAVYPTIIDLQRTGEGSSMFLLTIPLTPFVWLVYSEKMMNILISKAIYICPMKRAERRAYVRTLLHVRMGVPVLTAIVFELLWALLAHSGIIEVICIIFLYCSMGISFSVKSKLKNMQGNVVDYAFHEQDGTVKQSYINIANIILTAVMIVLVVAIENFHDVGLAGGFMIGSGMGLVCIFDILILVRQYKDCIDNACDYELYFHIKGK